MRLGTTLDIWQVRSLLKKKFEGEDVLEALRYRLTLHLLDPNQDPLSAQVWPAYQKLPHILKEPFSVLDVGCMSGFLFHYLNKYFCNFSYTGVDRWKAALQVGREFSQDINFIEADFLETELPIHDYVICSNIPFNKKDHIRAIPHLRKFCRRSLLMIYPSSEIKTFGPKSGAAATRDTDPVGSQGADLQDGEIQAL